MNDRENSKRRLDHLVDQQGGNKRGPNDDVENREEEKEDLIFEDPFEDELDDEEIVNDGMNDEMIIENENVQVKDEDDAEMKTETKVWRAGIDPINKDEVLDYDSSAYHLYYSMTAEWPCLSFDILKDNLGNCRTKFPMTVYSVSGTQASQSDENQITVMKMSDLHRTISNDEDSDSDDTDDGEMDGDPILESRSIKHIGGVNRIRSMPQCPHVVASWADTSKVHLWNISEQLQSLNGNTSSTKLLKSQNPLQTFTGHVEEGFSMDWSHVNQGHFLSGDCKKYIYHWLPSDANASSWTVDKIPFTGHKGSVEDIQWSPTEATVFASCSVDQTIRIWDSRKKNGSMLDVHAHDEDVNVISWNKNVSYLLVSGSDDGSFKIWDLRSFKSNSAVAHFRYHTAPITSVEWHPSDESALAVSSADHQLTVWDMSVEEDINAAGSSKNEKLELPPQLLFIHQGQKDIKELHFHPQCPGLLMSTASDGFNVFKPSNIS